MLKLGAAALVLGPLLILLGLVAALMRTYQPDTASGTSTVEAPTVVTPPRLATAVADIGSVTPVPNIQATDHVVETQIAAPAVTAAAAYTQTAVAQKQRTARSPLSMRPLLLGMPIEDAIARFGTPVAGSKAPTAYVFQQCVHGGHERWSVLAQEGLVVGITHFLCASDRQPAHWLQDLEEHLPLGTVFLHQIRSAPFGTIVRFYTNPALEQAQLAGRVGYGVLGCNGGGDPAGTLFASARLRADDRLDHWTLSIGGCWGPSDGPPSHLP